jgi:hypothetical protein
MKMLCVTALLTIASLAVGQTGPAKGHILWQFETGG